MPVNQDADSPQVMQAPASLFQFNLLSGETLREEEEDEEERVKNFSVPKHLTKEQVEHFREAFNLFDTDGSGCIDADELGACMRFLGKYYSEEEILEMIADWDLNESGTMNLTGFLGMISALTDCFDTERELYKAFEEFDPSHSGRLEMDTFRRIFKMHSRRDIYEDPTAKASGAVAGVFESIRGWFHKKTRNAVTNEEVDDVLNRFPEVVDRTKSPPLVDYGLLSRVMYRGGF